MVNQKMVNPLLFQIAVIVLMDNIRVGMVGIVGKQDVGNAIAPDIVGNIPGEVATVHDVNLFKRVEQVTGQGIAIAVFQNEQAPPVAFKNIAYFLNNGWPIFQ